jgi:hypothetical protein
MLFCAAAATGLLLVAGAIPFGAAAGFFLAAGGIMLRGVMAALAGCTFFVAFFTTCCVHAAFALTISLCAIAKKRRSGTKTGQQ